MFAFSSAKTYQFSGLTVSSAEVKRAVPENTSKTSELRTSTAVTLVTAAAKMKANLSRSSEQIISQSLNIDVRISACVCIHSP